MEIVKKLLVMVKLLLFLMSHRYFSGFFWSICFEFFKFFIFDEQCVCWVEFSLYWFWLSLEILKRFVNRLFCFIFDVGVVFSFCIIFFFYYCFYDFIIDFSLEIVKRDIRGFRKKFGFDWDRIDLLRGSCFGFG